MYDISSRSWESVPADIVREALASLRPSTSGETRYGWWKVPALTVADTDAMFSGFIRTPPCPISEAPIWAADCTGTAPSKVGTPIAQLFIPRPKTCWACWVRSSSLSFGAWLMKAVLQERAKLALNVPSLISNFLSFWNFQCPYVKYFGHGCFLSAEARPLSSSSEAVMTFIVEPGAREPWKAVLKPGEALAAARISPVEARMTATDDLAFFATCFSAAVWRAGSSVVFTVPGVPLLSSSRVLSERSSDLADFPRTTRSSIPALPPASLPYFSRSPSSTGPSEAYFCLVSSPPSRSSALTGGVPASPVTSLSPSFRSGWTTAECQSTSGFPSLVRRTTVSALSYASGFSVFLYATVPLTENGTLSPVGLPGVRVTSLTRASLV